MANLNFNADSKSNLASYTTSGQVIFTEDNLYLVKNDGSKIKYSSIEVVSSLPNSQISSDKIYILPDFSMNYYDSSWHKLNDKQIVIGNSNTDTTKLWLDTTSTPILKYYNGTSWGNVSGSSSQIQSDWNQNDNTKLDYINNKPTNLLTSSNIKAGTNINLNTIGNDVTISVSGSDAKSINSHIVDNSTYSPNRVLVADNSGNYTHANVNVAGLVATNGTILQPSGSPVTIASGEEKTFSYPSCYADKMLINIQEQIAGSSIIDNHCDFSDSNKYTLQDSTKLLFSGNTVKLKAGVTCVNNYKFEETSGTVCADSKGLYNGVYHGTTSVVGLDGTGYARSFNGSSDYISFSNPVIPYNKNFTIKFDFKKSVLPTHYETLITNRSSNGLEVTITPTKILNLSYFVSYPTSNGTLSYDMSPYFDGIKHTIIYRYTHATKTISLYVDDLINPKASLVLNSQITITGDMNLLIGYNNYSNYYFQGILDNLEIYNDIIDFSVSNTNPTYFKTTGASNFSLTTIDTITSLTIPVTILANTGIKFLFTVDNGVNWLYKDGTGIHKYTGDLNIAWTSYSNNTDLQTYFTNLPITTLTTDLSGLSIVPVSLDFAWQFSTTDITITPIASTLTMTYTTLPHLEYSTFGRYDDAYATFGVKIIRDPLDNTKTNQMAVKNLTNRNRTVNPNLIVTTS
jgi:hypothetical protein